MLHLWKHAFTFYLHVSIQSTLKQIYKWLVQKFYLSLQESVTVEIWPKIVKLAINILMIFLTYHMYVTGQNETQVKI